MTQLGPGSSHDGGGHGSSTRARSGVPLAELTTIRLGGPADRLVEATTDDEIVESLSEADAEGQPLLVLGGGSNLVVADAGFRGTVLRIATRGVSASRADGGVRLTVAAGEPWGEVVDATVAEGFSGIECLAGIPGTAGATPIQNVGAYGQQVSDAIVSVRVHDRRERRTLQFGREGCGFAYRSSIFRGSERFVVLGVTFELERSRYGQPIAYAQLARTLELELGARPSLAEIREAVLSLRRRKGMVLDAADPDSVSVGSFFVNPTMSAERFAELERRAATRPGCAQGPPRWSQPGGDVKTSAAWLIERAGIPPGFGVGRVGVSTKHTLALVNRGGATTGELIALARQIRAEVKRVFGVVLRPEPTLVGVRV